MADPSIKRVAILGSTGSIGRQALDVIASHRDRLQVVALVAGSDGDTLEAQRAASGALFAGLGAEAAERAATRDDVDVVLNAVVGAAGLRASVAALDAGKVLALANKESLVAGGEVCLAAAEQGGGRIVPVDSEHAAIAECLAGVAADAVERIALTASGGPFRTRQDLTGVSAEEALVHPTWSMGPKITIDSATLMNKGLEVIEAHWLFGLDYDHIDVVVHPQSAVHGIVHLVDGSSLMQAAPADMRVPIQAALLWPDKMPSSVTAIDLVEVGSLTFERVDAARFPAVGMAYQAGRLGHSYPATLNAANEVAVQAFLESRITFMDVMVVIDDVMTAHSPRPAETLDAVLEVDAWARAEAGRHVEKRSIGAAT